MKVYASYQDLPASTSLLDLYEQTKQSGISGFSLPLDVFRRETGGGQDESFREAIEGLSHLELPVLRADYDFIRSHLEDSARIASDLDWLASKGLRDLVMTITQGAHSAQIEDLEHGMAMKALRKAVSQAELLRIHLVLRLTARHMADSLGSAHGILREISNPSLCLSLDLETLHSQNHVEPEIAVKYFGKNLHFVEMGPNQLDLLPWLKAQNLEVSALVHDPEKPYPEFKKWMEETFGAEKAPLKEKRENRAKQEGKKTSSDPKVGKSESYPF
ncbi:MAG: hypothetical protein JNM63_12180 [Spirochaetia bacterium]|nr:hypothetical protein [Spirochaetia bacterium]